MKKWLKWVLSIVCALITLVIIAAIMLIGGKALEDIVIPNSDLISGVVCLIVGLGGLSWLVYEIALFFKELIFDKIRHKR